jgi:Acyl-CoA dehydrogenase, N-terminal domain
MASPFYTAEHEAYREVVRRFVEKEIEPYAHEWDEAGGFPRVLYEKAAAIGLLGLAFRMSMAAPKSIISCGSSRCRNWRGPARVASAPA